jgi:hypothetical protein
MTLISKFGLFLSSFAPLFLLLAIRHLSTPSIAVALLVIALVGPVGLALVEWFGRTVDDTYVVDRVESRAESLTGYLTGYLFPFLVLDFNDIYAVAATVGFGLMLAVLYVQGNLLYLNPVLMLRGWRVWTIDAHLLDAATKEKRLVVIVRNGALERGDHIGTSTFAGDVRIGRPLPEVVAHA